MVLAAKKVTSGTFLVVQWLGLCNSTAGGKGLIPGQGTKILHTTWHAPPQKKVVSRACGGVHFLAEWLEKALLSR